MAVLESCPKHNMVAYLEKTDGNAEFHEIIDFLARSSIHNALTVSPVVSTTFVEQFWMSAKSKIINNVRYITAKVAGKPVSISEASIRSDLLFDDADGIDSLPNQAIFDAIQLMGYEGDLTGKHFSGKVTPLFSNMLVQPTEDEGEQSERPSEPQLTPSPPHHSGGNHGSQSSSDKSLSGNEGDMTLQSVYDLYISLCTLVTDQAKEIKHLKAQIKKLKKKAKHWMQKESVSKHGRKPAKVEPSVHKDPLFDELANDTLDYMDTENAQDVGRTRNVVYEEEESVEDAESAEDAVSTKDVVSTDKEKVSTDRLKVSTNKEKDNTDRPDEGTEGRSATPTTQTPTPTTFGDDETIAQVLLNMSQAKAVLREKKKGVKLKDVEKTKRPRPTSTRSLLTLKPLPKIDPKDKGKKIIEEEDESDTESEAEEEVKKLAEEEAIKAALLNEYDFIQARMEVEKLAEEEVKKFLHDTIAAQRRFLAEQRAIAIRNRPPTRTQLRNQMMTYLKHVGNKKHSDIKNKTFEEIQDLYEKVKRFDESFTVVGSTEDERSIKDCFIGSAEDERMIKEMNEKGIDSSKNESVKEEGKEEEGTKKRKSGHIKMIARKKPRKQSDDDSDDEHRKCLKIVTFKGTLDSEIMEKKFFIIARLDMGNHHQMEFILQDLFHLYELMMEQYSEITLEGFELILWGDLKIMMESSTEENDQSDFWSNQQDWKIITWRLYEACGVCILELEDGIVINMLVERRYPLSKELLQRMLDLGLEVERESSVALDLIRFIKQQIDEE
ncbi:hypothetical protein Tco_1235437 [Tanacetum coccineum]